MHRSRRNSFNKTKRIPQICIHKNKIKALLKNNELLARALQNDRVIKEELWAENISNAELIMFSRLKIASLSENLKEIVTGLDETLALMETHSSVTCSKLTSKNILGGFKEQVRKILMDPIPEEQESPEKTSNHKNNEITHQNKKPCESQPLNEQSSVKEAKKVCMGTLNHEYCQPISPVKNYEECSPAKLAKLCNKNKIFTSKVCRKKRSTKPTANKKSSKVSKDVIWDSVKRAGSLNKNINIKESSSLSKINSQSSLHNNVQVLQNLPENNINAKYENKNGGILCTLTDSVSSSKLHGNDTYSFSDCEKENKNSNLKKSAKKLKSLGDVELGPMVSKRNYGRNSALKSLSSRFNIETFKDSEGKGRTCQIDDLITTKQKSDSLMMSNKCPKTSGASESYSQDLNLYQREMIKNLASNTYLVTAEVHKNSNPLESDRMKIQKSDCFVSKPVVLVNDIFQSSKSLCKSISGPTCDEFNGASLELELLKHCSSLKVISEESEDQTEENSRKRKSHSAETLLTIEDNVIKKYSDEEKRAFRRRSSTVNYKEPNLNAKLRR